MARKRKERKKELGALGPAPDPTLPGESVLGALGPVTPDEVDGWKRDVSSGGWFGSCACGEDDCTRVVTLHEQDGGVMIKLTDKSANAESIVLNLRDLLGLIHISSHEAQRLQMKSPCEEQDEAAD